MRGLLANTAAPLGRVLLCAIFLLSGVHKLTDWSGTAGRMTEKGVPNAHFLLVGAVALEIAGGLSILLGCWPRVGAAMLIGFLVPTTFFFHDFWMVEGQERQMQMIHFMKNLAIMGGLLIVLDVGGGGFSLSAVKGQSNQSDEG